MTVLAILGSPSKTSRTARLIDRSRVALAALDIELQTISIHDFPADALLHGQFSHPQIQDFQQRVGAASGLIIATPVYKAAYAGALKVLLDLIPEGGLAGKPVLPLVSGGSPGHLLAVDYSIKPVLAALKASAIHQGVYAVESQIGANANGEAELAEELEQRLQTAVHEFAALLGVNAPAPHAPRYANDFISRLISL
jgi:FMN reductase